MCVIFHQNKLAKIPALAITDPMTELFFPCFTKCAVRGKTSLSCILITIYDNGVLVRGIKTQTVTVKSSVNLP